MDNFIKLFFINNMREKVCLRIENKVINNYNIKYFIEIVK
jgi:hypothetical protein